MLAWNVYIYKFPSRTIISRLRYAYNIVRQIELHVTCFILSDFLKYKNGGYMTQLHPKKLQTLTKTTQASLAS